MRILQSQCKRRSLRTGLKIKKSKLIYEWSKSDLMEFYGKKVSGSIEKNKI